MFTGIMAAHYRLLFRGFWGAWVILWALFPVKWVTNTCLPGLLAQVRVPTWVSFPFLLIMSFFFLFYVVKGPHERKVRM